MATRKTTRKRTTASRSSARSSSKQRRGKTIPGPIVARLDAFRARFDDWKVDAVLVTSERDGFYLTGFAGESGAVLVTRDAVVLITDGRFDEQADREAPWATKFVRKAGRTADTYVAQMAKRGLKTVGVFPGAVTVEFFDALRKACKSDDALKGKPSISLKKLRGSLHDQRQIKDADEVAAIRRAVEVAEKAFQQARKRLKDGVTEADFAAELAYRMQKLGAVGPSFDTIVASGPNAALAHYRPAETKIDFKKGLLIDWGARLNHYVSDLTRVLLPEKPPKAWSDLYAVCLDAQLAAIEACQPGNSVREPDLAARRVMKKAKLEKLFTHSLGHGIGLDVHEFPRVSKNVKDDTARLEPGMVVTIEPGLYVAGQAGIRIEDDVLITHNGHEVLSTLSKNPDDMRL